MIMAYSAAGCGPRETNLSLKGKGADFTFINGVSVAALDPPYEAYQQRLEKG